MIEFNRKHTHAHTHPLSLSLSHTHTYSFLVFIFQKLLKGMDWIKNFFYKINFKKNVEVDQSSCIIF